MRGLGILLLTFVMAAVAFDGFRERERARTAPANAAGSVEPSAHASDFIGGANWPR